MKYFVKVHGFWFEYDNTTPLSCARLFDNDFKECFYADIRDLEIVQSKTKEDLDWNDTIILNKNFKTGWLSPEGKFYGCKEYKHGVQAVLIHKKDEFKLEQEGWIRINYNFLENGEIKLVVGFASSDETIYPTREQLKFLLKNYQDNKDLYYEMWDIANQRKQAIQEEWGVN